MSVSHLHGEKFCQLLLNTDSTMKFLNSVLGSIGGTGAQPLPRPIQPTRVQNADTLQQGRSVQTGDLLVADVPPQSNKRKAEDGLSGRNGKTVKSSTSEAPSSRVAPPADALRANLNTPSKPVSSLPSKVSVPYRGTSKLNLASSATETVSPTPAIPVGEAAKPPKKGSYAEIMARAKATQAKPLAVGVISHKPKDKIAISHKKELKMNKKASKDRKLGIKQNSRPGSSGSLSSSPAPGSSKPTKTLKPQPAYKGTAKPKPQPTYKGTMKPDGSMPRKPASKDRDSHASRNRYDEYAATDEEDLDDVAEDQYGSEGSEDMEAGFSDVEQEESVAAKAARKEDEEEARLEAQLKKEKDDRRKRLEAMAKKAKPQRY